MRHKREMLLVTERADVKRLAVESIIIPIEGNVPQKPSVGPEDRIVDTIEVMLKNDLKRIAVIDGNSVVGMIKLEDALEKLGLKGDLRSRGKRSIVVHGRKIILDE
ncbi:MAG: CBS domain-containing protein [Desulfobacterales bacterium]|nr:MAG: CBS domain-containing protein [Desulfobacterales bacterium]